MTNNIDAEIANMLDRYLNNVTKSCIGTLLGIGILLAIILTGIEYCESKQNGSESAIELNQITR